MRTSMVLFLFCIAAFADSKSEAALKAQLAIARVQHDSDVREKTKLDAALASLKAGQATQKAGIAKTEASVNAGRGEAADSAYRAAQYLEDLRLTVENNAILARKAEADAKVEKERTAGLLIVAKSENVRTLILQIFGILGLCTLPLVQYILGKRTRQDMQAFATTHAAAIAGVNAAVIDTKETVHQLEVNTNNKMDKLLETTSKAKFAEGKLQGAEEEKLKQTEENQITKGITS